MAFTNCEECYGRYQYRGNKFKVPESFKIYEDVDFEVVQETAAITPIKQRQTNFTYQFNDKYIPFKFEQNVKLLQKKPRVRRTRITKKQSSEAVNA